MIDQIKIDDLADHSQGLLTLNYVLVRQAVFWEDNPKEHDIGSIMVSIEDHGFRDPPAWDSALEAIVTGNGRTTVLDMMEKQGRPVPRGIALTSEGYWAMPMLFGVDAKSKLDAERYGIDHNNLTMIGGDFSLFDVTKMWDREAYIQKLEEMAEADNMPTSIDHDDLNALIARDKKPEAKDEEDFEEDLANTLPAENDFLDEETEPVTLVVHVMNGNLAEDVFESIEVLLEENPGWDAMVKMKQN